MRKLVFCLAFLVCVVSARADEYLACDVVNLFTPSPDWSKKLKALDFGFFVVKSSDAKRASLTMITNGKEISTETLARAEDATFNGNPTIQYKSEKKRGVTLAFVKNSNQALIGVHEFEFDVDFTFVTICKP